MRALITDMELRKLIIKLDPRQEGAEDDVDVTTEEMAVYAAAYFFANPTKKESNQMNTFRKQVAYFFKNGNFRTADEMGQ